MKRKYDRNRDSKERDFVDGIDRTSGFYGKYGVDGELKFLDIGNDTPNVPVGGGMIPTMNVIPQGTGESERIGRKCIIRKIRHRYALTVPGQIEAGPTFTASDIVRVIFYVDKQCNGQDAVVGDILAPVPDFQSFFNLQNSQRFAILHDRTYALNPTSGGAATPSLFLNQFEVVGHFNVSCHIPLEFSGTNGTITEIRSYNCGVLVISKNAVASYESRTRFRFSDA